MNLITHLAITHTISDTIGFVAQAFRSSLRPDPRLDVDGNQCYLLQQLLKGYSNLDPGTKQQKAIPFSVLMKLFTLGSTCALTLAIAQLAMGAWFFAMRSCEYSKTSSKEESKRTKILRLRNIRFFYNGRVLPHPSPHIHLSDYVDITFEYQKNDERNESVGMYRSDTKRYHAVSVWAAIVRRIRGYEGANDDWKVNMFQYRDDKGNVKNIEITSNRIRTKLRVSAKIIGKEKLGFDASDIGCHSIRSGAAMALYLAKVPVLTIMIIGRWKSDSFLRYIRKQVAMFSHNLTDKMLESEHFFTTPDFERVHYSRRTHIPKHLLMKLKMDQAGTGEHITHQPMLQQATNSPRIVLIWRSGEGWCSEIEIHFPPNMSLYYLLP